MEKNTLRKIYDLAIDRKRADPEASYVARLYKKGEDKILEKVGEEAVETILAHKGGDEAAIVYETADLWFHTIVALAQKNIPVDQVFDELERRYGKSGLLKGSEDT